MKEDIYKNRDVRSIGAICEKDLSELKDKKVFVAGCGGLGGNVIQMLFRFGVLNMTIADYDIFEESNLNRQIFSREDVIGRSKTEVTKEELLKINSLGNITTINEKLGENNLYDLLSDYDIIIDCLDSRETRLILEDACSKNNKILVHGAIGGWFSQVCTIYPGEYILKKIYKESENINMNLGSTSFTPALTASIQVSEAIKVLLGKEDILRNKLLYINLKTNSFEVLDIN